MASRPLYVFTTDPNEAVNQDVAPEDILKCNQPMLRRQKILEAISKSTVDARIREVLALSCLVVFCCVCLGFIFRLLLAVLLLIVVSR
jgi:hypothetical protein